MGVIRIEEELCNGCAICFDICPMDVFRIDQDRGKAFIKYLRECQSCFLCEAECPVGAIYVTPYRERRLPIPW